MASATAVTAVGAVVGVAHGTPASAAAAPDVAGSTLLADVPSGIEVQAASDNISLQADAQQAAATAAQQKAADEAARVAAAHAATAKINAEKAAAAKVRAAAQAKAEAQQAAADRATLAQTYAPGTVQALAESIIGNATQFSCFSDIVSRESGWNYTATNAASGAYGLVQALPGSKMASAGADWRTNPATQIKWGLSYMDSRYGSPCGAWSFWQAHSWY